MNDNNLREAIATEFEQWRAGAIRPIQVSREFAEAFHRRYPNIDAVLNAWPPLWN